MIPDRVLEAIAALAGDDKAKSEELKNQHADLRLVLLRVSDQRQAEMIKHNAAVGVLSSQMKTKHESFDAELEAMRATCPHISYQVFGRGLNRLADCDTCRSKFPDPNLADVPHVGDDE